MRKLVLGLITAAAIGSSGCATKKPAPVVPQAPRAQPVVRYGRKLPKSNHWLQAALNINHPSDLKKWEPFIEEISGGKPPVPYTRVRFSPREAIPLACEGDAGGCFIVNMDFPKGRIFVKDEMSPGKLEPHTYENRRDIGSGGGCKGGTSEDIKERSRFMVWLHEQGHAVSQHNGDSWEDKWINQVEAVAFEYYAAQHIARRYDGHLGLNLILRNFETYMNPGVPFTAGEPEDMKIAHYSFFILLTADWYKSSFGDVWKYVYSHKPSEVAAKIKANLHLLPKGKEKARRYFFDLAGRKVKESHFDEIELIEKPMSLGTLRHTSVEHVPHDVEILHFHYNNRVYAVFNKHIVSFSHEERDAKVTVHTVSGEPVMQLEYDEEKKKRYIILFKASLPILKLDISSKNETTYSRKSTAYPSFCTMQERTGKTDYDGLLYRVSRPIYQALTEMERRATKQEVAVARKAAFRILKKPQF